MKKRLLSLALALALCLGLAVPTFAADNSAAEQTSTMLLTHSIDGHNFENSDGIDVTYSWKLNYTDTISLDERTFTEDYNGYFATRKDTVFTVTNTAPAGQNNFIRVYVYLYEKVSGNVYEHSQYPHGQYLTQSGTFISDMARPDDYGGLVELKPGESFQFKLPEVYDRGEFNQAKGEYDMIPRSDADVIYKVELMKWDMDNSQTVTDEWGNTYEEAPTYNKWAMFKVDNAAVDSYLAGSSTATPSTPSATDADRFPYSIPSTPDFLRFSVQPIGSYQMELFDIDSGRDKTVTVYAFPLGTSLGLTAEGIQQGYSIGNLSSYDFDDLNRTEFTLTKATVAAEWFMVNSLDDPSGFIAYIHPINTNTSFSDVRAGEYYENAVKWAVQYGITNGTSDTTFSPNQNCSNAQILTFLYRANGEIKASISNPFSDVNPTDYYYDAALWAAEMGMVSGSTFGPDKPCTRAMAVTYLWKALGSPEVGAFTGFSDVSSGADYAKAVSWAVVEEVTNGTSTTTFSPNETCTRGQIVTFLHRAMG